MALALAPALGLGANLHRPEFRLELGSHHVAVLLQKDIRHPFVAQERGNVMNARELWEWIGEHTTPDDEVILEVGGDGAIHTGTVRNINRQNNRVTLTTEG